MAIQEDDVLEILADYLKSYGFSIFALGGNQAGLFNYHLFLEKQKYRKAPDIVAFKNPYILVCEGKVRTPDLFKENTISDYQAVDYLINSDKAKNEILNQIYPILKQLNINFSKELRLVGCLIGASVFDFLLEKVENTDIIILEVDADNIKVNKILDTNNVIM